MSGGHSEVAPRLPIPNRTVKRLSADDSADTRVKVGHRQTPLKNPKHRVLGVSCILAAQIAAQILSSSPVGAIGAVRLNPRSVAIPSNAVLVAMSYRH